LIGAGLNVVPPAVFILGVGGLAFGAWPRGAIGVVYGLVVWSLIYDGLCGERSACAAEADRERECKRDQRDEPRRVLRSSPP
jgi:hypothetical protein